MTVWRQADRYKIPRLVYVNKMDRPIANFEMSCNSVEKKLHVEAVPIQKPIIRDFKFVGNSCLIFVLIDFCTYRVLGLVDLLTMEKLLWNPTNYSVSRENLTEKIDGQLWEEAKEARSNLVDKLSGRDDTLANLVIAADSLDAINTADIVTTLRKLTIEQVWYEQLGNQQKL